MQQLLPDAAALSSIQGLPRSGFLQITAQANLCSRHLWGTLARSVASIWWHQATPKNVPYLLSDSCILKCRQVICTKTIFTLPDAPSSSSSTALPAPNTKSAFLCACRHIGNRVQASGSDWTDRMAGCRCWGPVCGCDWTDRLSLIPPFITPAPEDGLAWRKEGCFNRWNFREYKEFL